MTAPGRTPTPEETALVATDTCEQDRRPRGLPVACQYCIAAAIRAAEAPLRERIAELERLANDNAFSGMQHKARADTAEERIAELEKAIRWALGEGEEFPPRPPGAGSYWWRTELRARARLAARAGGRPK